MNHYLCPVCRAPRKIALKDGIGAAAHFKIFLTTLSLCLLAWVGLGTGAAFKTSIVYLIFWGATEFVHWVKMKSLAKCQVCNFDPMLYRQDWKQARSLVEDRLNKTLEETKDLRRRQIQGLRTSLQRAPGAVNSSAVPPAIKALTPAQAARTRAIEAE